MLHGDSLWELIEGRADRSPDSLMAVDADMRIVTFAEFHDQAQVAAAGLAGAGIGAGDVVSWQLPNWIESMVLAAALSRLGALQNPIPLDATQDDVARITSSIGSTLLVVPRIWNDHDYESMAMAVASQNVGLRILVADHTLPQGDVAYLPPKKGPVPECPSDGGHLQAISQVDLANGLSNNRSSGHRGDAAWVFYAQRWPTGLSSQGSSDGSGDAVMARGVLHSDRTLATAARGLSQRLGLIDRDRHSLVAPIADIHSILWMFASLQSGCGNIVVDGLDDAETVDVLSRESMTLAGGGARWHSTYVAYQRKEIQPIFPDVRAFVGGDQHTSTEMFDIVRSLFEVPILSGYSITEAPIVSIVDLGEAESAPTAGLGRPLFDVEVRIVDLVGKDLPPGSEGEVLVRGPQVTLGYVHPAVAVEPGHPSAVGTVELDHEGSGDSMGQFDSDGFLHTGDLGRVDEYGNLVVTGRSADCGAVDLTQGRVSPGS